MTFTNWIRTKSISKEWCHWKAPGLEWAAQWHPGSGCRGEGPWVSVSRSLNSEMLLAHLWSSEPAAASPSGTWCLKRAFRALRGTEEPDPDACPSGGEAVGLGVSRGSSSSSALRTHFALSTASGVGATVSSHPPQAELLHGHTAFSQEKVFSDSLIK